MASQTPATAGPDLPDRRVTERGIAVDLTPAGTGLSMTGRRVLFAALVIATIVGVLGLTAAALAPDGFDSVD